MLFPIRLSMTFLCLRPLYKKDLQSFCSAKVLHDKILSVIITVAKEFLVHKISQSFHFVFFKFKNKILWLFLEKFHCLLQNFAKLAYGKIWWQTYNKVIYIINKRFAKYCDQRNSKLI